MKHFTQTHFLILLCASAVGFTVSCGDKDDDKPKPKVMTIEAQHAAIQEAVKSAIPMQLMAPPAMPMGGAYTCTGEISFLEPTGRREELAIRYKHSCK